MRAEANETEGLFVSFMRNLPGAAFIKDGKGRYTYVNEECEEVFQLKQSEWIGKTDDELWPPEVAAEFKKNDRRVRVCGHPVQIVETFQYKDELRYWLVHKFPIRDLSGDPGSVGGIAIDITKRKLMEVELRRSLKESQERRSEIAALLEGSRAVLQRSDFKGAARAIFAPCLQLVGAAAGYVALLDDENNDVEALFIDSQGKRCQVEPHLPMPLRGLREMAIGRMKAVYHNDFPGSAFAMPAAPSQVPVKNALFAPMVIEGEVVGLLGMCDKSDDFTENDALLASAFADFAAIALLNKKAEEELRHSKRTLELKVAERTNELTALNEQLKQEIAERKQAQDYLRLERDRFMSILQTMQGHVCIINAQYDVDYVNPQAEQEFGPVGAKKCFEYFHDRAEPCPWCQNQQVFEGKIVRSTWTSEKSHRTYSVSESAIRNADGTVSKLSITHDITEDKRIEEALRLSEEKYRELVENANSIIVRVDSAGSITFFNEFAQRFFEYSENEILGRDITDTIAPGTEPHRSKLLEALQAAAQSPEQSESIESETVLSNGKIVWIAWNIKALSSNDGGVREFLCIGNDITNRKEAEKQLRFLSSRLLTTQEEERQRIARELHDSIGSSLTAIKFSLEDALQLMEQGTANPEILKALILLAQGAIDDSRRIITDLRPSVLDDLGIVATIEWFCRQFQSIYLPILIHHDVKVEEGDVPEALKIVLFRVMQEAFHNIAKHSLAKRVDLTLEKSQEKISLVIRDNGVGFVLDSGRSGKNTGGGFGLTGMKERTELSGGTFAVQSDLGKGTVVLASWPVE